MQNRIEQTLTSLEVAEMIRKEHHKLLRDIRRYCDQLNEAKIGLVDFFKESTYKDTKGEIRPCYQITKKGCEFIAHKLTGVKGTEFTAKYINKFHEMKQFIEDNSIKNYDVSFNEVVKTLPIFADFLKVNDVSKLIMAEKLCESYNIPTSFLPDYVKGGDREAKSAKELLKQIGSNISSIKFNQILLENGYLEERKRPSKSSKSGVKVYKALTEKGLKYGENLISPNNPKETQPHYYVDTFEELYESLSM